MSPATSGTLPTLPAVRWLAIAGLFFALVSTSSAQTGGRPLRTGFLDPGAFTGPSADRSVARARTAGASLARLFLVWSEVAPQPPSNATDPNDSGYNWASIDQQVVDTSRGGLSPLVYIGGAPGWAKGASVGLPGTWPSPTKLGQFMKAAARRYSGTFTPAGQSAPLPRVRFWECWDEPNAGSEMAPQRVNGKPVSPAHYRKMLNAFADAVHGVDRSNLVVGGTLGPFGHNSKDIQVIAPKVFMGELLCVSTKPPYHKTCSQTAHFDVWAHNPYTNGGPNWQAHSPNDVSIGDLPEMRAILTAASRNGTVVSAQSPEFWVTEFSWDTNPPDPKGVPSALHARWVSEALYRMWSAGVSAVIWFRLQDDPLRSSPYQSGFFTTSGKAKYSLEAFRFPFVAFRKGAGVTVWGRTPTGKPGSVIVERQAGSGAWSKVVQLRADQFGIFSDELSSIPAGTTSYRARLASPSESSIPFSLTVPPGRKTTAFGCGGPIPCR